MADDQVTIVPEFTRQSPPDPQASRGVRRAAVALVITLLGLGAWLAWPSSDDNTGAAQGMGGSPTSTGPPEVTAPLLEQPRGEGLAELDSVLSDTVGGFFDAVVLLETKWGSYDIVHWAPSWTSTRTTLSLDRNEEHRREGVPVGLDSSGGWFAEILSDGVLAVHPVGLDVDRADYEAAGLRARSPIWHDGEPGRIAWLTCPRTTGGSTTLFTLDMSDSDAEPVATHTFDQPCVEVVLSRWICRGILYRAEPSPWPILLGPDGTKTPITNAHHIVCGGPGGQTLWYGEIPESPETSAFILSPDDSTRGPVPGLGAGERVRDARWSPDGELLALNVWDGLDSRDSVLRIVEVASGDIIVESAEPGSEVVEMEWSDDARFLAFEIWQEENSAAFLAFHDLASVVTTVMPLSDIVDEIRIVDTLDALTRHGGPTSAIDRSAVAASDIAAHPDRVSPLPFGDPSLDDPAPRLPLEARSDLPDSPRLDFLHTVCFGSCSRDAVMVDSADGSGRSGGWLAGVPFHIRHGFVNDSAQPLGEEFDVVVYVTRVRGPWLGEEAGFELNRAYRFTSDYVVRAGSAQCGPGYWDQTERQPCEWFVHEFATGLPPGRYDIWARWFAPCSAWQQLGLIDACPDPALVTSQFAGSVNMPFDDDSGY